MASVYIKFIRSDNKTFILGTGSWRILSNGLQGVDFPSFSVYSEKNAIGDGALLSGKRVDDRDIQIEAKSIDPTNNRAIRDATISFFNPKYSFKLYITYMGVTRWIEGELSGFKCPSENIHRPMKLTVKFYCKDGFLKSVDDFGKDIASISPGFGFPYIQTVSPVIPVYASIYNYNQEIIDTFEDGDDLVIDFENCTIYKNGVNWIQYIDRSSTFTDMGLGIGDSTMGFEADDGDAYMAVFVYYNKLYLGM